MKLVLLAQYEKEAHRFCLRKAYVSRYFWAKSNIDIRKYIDVSACSCLGMDRVAISKFNYCFCLVFIKKFIGHGVSDIYFK